MLFAGVSLLLDRAACSWRSNPCFYCCCLLMVWWYFFFCWKRRPTSTDKPWWPLFVSPPWFRLRWRLSGAIRSPLLFFFQWDQNFTVAAAVAFEVVGGFLIFPWRRGGRLVALLPGWSTPASSLLVLSDTMFVMLIAFLLHCLVLFFLILRSDCVSVAICIPETSARLL